MELRKIVDLTKRPEVYSQGTGVMWTDEYISERLLEIHLNPDIELASRKSTTIDETIDWILDRIPGEGLEILDLGCGPGLYAEKLAEIRHRVTGVDFSEGSIRYARESAAKGFWRGGPYLALTESFYYEEERVTLSQHLVIGESEEVAIYRFWIHTFSPAEIEELLAVRGFRRADCYDRIIPGCEMYRYEDVTFCLATK